jgi:hypothetical protein
MKTLTHKRFWQIVVLCLAMAFFPLSAIHALPNTLHWQGKIYVQTLPFNGTGQFKFILHNGSNCLWSNTQGESCSALSEPSTAITRNLVQGVYEVDLGNTAITNMASMSPTMFVGSSVYLRIWFNDGSNGFQLLTPDETLSAVPFAMFTNTTGTANIAQGVARMTTVQRDALPSSVAGTLIYNTSINELNVYSGTTWTSVASSSNFSAKDSAFLTMSATSQAPAQNEHIEFDTVIGNLSLSTGGGQNNGKITLIAGRKYILEGSIAGAGSGSGAQYLISQWWDITNNQPLGVVGQAFSMSYGGGDPAPQSIAKAIVTPLTNIQVELREVGVNNFAVIYGAANNSTYAYIESVTDYTVPGYLPNNGGTLGGDLTVQGELSINSTTKAFLPPRMTSSQRIAVSPKVRGMQVYDSDIDVLLIYNGKGDKDGWSEAGAPPVGSIEAWTNHIPGSPVSLPYGWVSCNGQVLNDSASSLNGQTLPDLNNPGGTAGVTAFLRGTTGNTGSFQNDTFQGHQHNVDSGSSGSGLVTSGGGYDGVGLSTVAITTDGINGAPRVANETRPRNMSVIWIMRVK